MSEIRKAKEQPEQQPDEKLSQDTLVHAVGGIDIMPINNPYQRRIRKPRKDEPEDSGPAGE